MVLSFISEFDNSARNVIDLLRYIRPGLEIRIITDHSNLHPLEIELNNDVNREDVGDFSTDDILFYYYRRGVFRSFIHEEMRIFDYESKEWLKKEEEYLFEYIEKRIILRDGYGSLFLEKSSNKLINLTIAIQSGFTIPRTLVTTSKHILSKFYNSIKNGIIVKPISNHRPLSTKRGMHFIPLMLLVMQESLFRILIRTLLQQLRT